MANYIKKELDTFEYDKRYSTLIEHRWCNLKKDENLEKFYKEKEKAIAPRISIIQSDIEKTGQIGTMI